MILVILFVLLWVGISIVMCGCIGFSIVDWGCVNCVVSICISNIVIGMVSSIRNSSSIVCNSFINIVFFCFV